MCGEKTQACSYITPSPPKIPSTLTFLHVSNLGGDPEVSWLFLSPQNMLYHEGLSRMWWWGEVRCGSDAYCESNGAFSFRIPSVFCLFEQRLPGFVVWLNAYSATVEVFYTMKTCRVCYRSAYLQRLWWFLTAGPLCCLSVYFFFGASVFYLFIQW